jgi:hypothetical protein
MLYYEALQLEEDANRVFRGEKLPTIPLVNLIKDKPIVLSNFIYAYHGMYLLFAGPSGTGKTSFVDTNFVLNPVLSAIDGKMAMKPNVVYRVMERSVKLKVAKWVCYLLLWKYNKVMSIPILLGWNNRTRDINEEDLRQINAVMPLIEKMGDYIDLIHGATDGDSIVKYAKERALRVGVLIEGKEDGVHFSGNTPNRNVIPYDAADKKGNRYKDLNMKSGEKIRVTPDFNKYVVSDPDMVNIHVTDHVAKIKFSGSEKEALDNYSQGIAELRDAGMYFICDIAQFNRSTDNKDRKDLHLTMSDIYGSSKFSQNIDILLAIIDPSYYNMSQWGDEDKGYYQVNDMGKRLRILQIIKNTYGESNIKIPLLFIGENGYFEELPPPHDVDYARINTLYNPRINNFYKREVPEVPINLGKLAKFDNNDELPF